MTTQWSRAAGLATATMLLATRGCGSLPGDVEDVLRADAAEIEAAIGTLR